MKKYAIILLFICSFGAVFSQIKVQGKVMIRENEADTPLAFANVRLFNPGDSTHLIVGASTLEDGSFSIIAPPRKCTLVISYLGYETYSSEIDVPNISDRVLDVGVVRLKEDENILSEITIGAKRKKQEIDKVNVTFSEEQIRKARDTRDLIS